MTKKYSFISNLERPEGIGTWTYLKIPIAQQKFNMLAPSHQKAYIEWIGQAKKAETREKRIKIAIERLMAGEVLKR